MPIRRPFGFGGKKVVMEPNLKFNSKSDLFFFFDKFVNLKSKFNNSKVIAIPKFCNMWVNY